MIGKGSKFVFVIRHEGIPPANHEKACSRVEFSHQRGSPNEILHALFAV